MKQSKWKRIPKGEVSLSKLKALLEPHVLGVIAAKDGLIILLERGPTATLALEVERERLVLNLPFGIEAGVPEDEVLALLRGLNAVGTPYVFGATDIGRGLLSAKRTISVREGISAKQCLNILRRAAQEVRQALHALGNDILEPALIEYDLVLDDDLRPESEGPLVMPKTITA